MRDSPGAYMQVTDLEAAYIANAVVVRRHTHIGPRRDTIRWV